MILDYEAFERTFYFACKELVELVEDDPESLAELFSCNPRLHKALVSFFVNYL
jgi:hypothetical protein